MNKAAYRESEVYGVVRLKRSLFEDLQKVASRRKMRPGTFLNQILKSFLAEEKLKLGQEMIQEAEAELATNNGK